MWTKAAKNIRKRVDVALVVGAKCSFLSQRHVQQSAEPLTVPASAGYLLISFPVEYCDVLPDHSGAGLKSVKPLHCDIECNDVAPPSNSPPPMTGLGKSLSPRQHLQHAAKEPPAGIQYGLKRGLLRHLKVVSCADCLRRSCDTG